MTFATKRFTIVVAIFLLFVFHSVAFAGLTGKISGQVVDSRGEGLPGVAIQLEGTTIGALSDFDGNFVILNVPPGEYTAKIRLVGYKTHIAQEVNVETDKTFSLNATLEETALEGDSVVVIAKKDPIKISEVQNVRTVTAGEIETMPVSDVDEILSIQVGVVSRNGEIHIRGGRAGEVSYIVDGVETRDPLGGLGATDIGMNMTSNSLQEVQIIKAGFDAEYGGVMSGVVRMTTREGSVQLTQGHVEYWTDNFHVPEMNDYSFNYDRFSFNMGGPEPFLSNLLLPALGIDYFQNKLSYFVSLDVTKTDGPISYNDWAPPLHQRTYPSHDFLGLTIQDRQYNNYKIITKLTFRPTNSMKLTLNFTGEWDRNNPLTNLSWDYRYAPSFASYVEQDSYLFSINFNHQVSPTTFYEILVSRYSNNYYQAPDNPNNPGNPLFPNDVLMIDEYERYADLDGNGRYDAPEPFINVTGDTVFGYPFPQYTEGDAMGFYGSWYSVAEFWEMLGEEFHDNYYKRGWKTAQFLFDTLLWDWDGDGFIDNGDAEPYADLNGNGQWDAGDLVWWDTNGNGVYDPERGQFFNVDAPDSYEDEDINLCEPFIDINHTGVFDSGMDKFIMSYDPAINMDLNRNSQYDGPNSPWSPGVPYEDLNGNGLYDAPNGRYDYGERFVDLNHNGKWDSADNFYEWGYDQWMFYQERTSVTNTVNAKFTNQLFTELEFNTGIQFKYNELSMADVRYPFIEYDGVPDGGPWPDRGIFRDFYEQYPYEMGLYTQFKLEFGSLIARLGARMDNFFQSANVEELEAEDLEGKDLITSHTKFSPRVGVSYPITEKAKIYFNYGHFYQLPQYQYMYRRATQASSAFGIVGNVNLDFQKNIQYEFGVKYTLSNDYVLDIAGFYNDWFGLINSQRKTYGPFSRNEYENSDYARTRGLELELRKLYGNYIRGSVSYTYSFAYGKSSSESSNYFDDFYNRAIPIQEFPLNWDVTHQLSVHFELHIGKSDKPKLFGFRIPNDWNLSVIWQYGTGYPYTPTRDYPGLRLLPGEDPLNNSLRYPAFSNVDLRFRKNFKLLNLDYSFEINVSNLFDTQTIDFLYGATGRPDTGTNVGGQVKEGTDYANDPQNYGSGRNIRVGLSMNF